MSCQTYQEDFPVGQNNAEAKKRINEITSAAVE
jgi:hypothetical protein